MSSSAENVVLKINLEWDANALAAPQSFRDSVQAAANVLQAAIYNPITVNIVVGYGEYDNGNTQLPGGISLGGIDTSLPVSYAALKAALTNNESAQTDISAFSSLPATAALNGQDTFYIAPAVGKALGVIGATDSSVDGYAGFPTNFTGLTLTSAAIVELIHALGLLNSGNVLSLFEYTSPGNHLLTAGATGTSAYFSIDGGVTNLATYDVGFDSTLFSNPTNDPFSVPVSGNLVLSALDLTELSAIGFDVTSAKSLPTPTITPTTTAAGTSAKLTVQNISVAENAGIAVSSLIKSISVPVGDSIAGYSFYDQGNGTGHFALNGVTEPDKQWLDVLSSQLGTLQYIGGTAPGSETLFADAYDYTANTNTSVGVATVTTMLPAPPLTVNNADGTSSLYVYNATTSVTQTITKYGGPNATGTVISNIVDNSDGTALLYAYNPTSTVTQTATAYSSNNATTGAPTGTVISNVVDNSDGTALLYAYNPTSTVTQTTSKYSSIDPSNGAPAGAQLSDVVDNADGTALLYAYNPTSTVTQTTSDYSSIDPRNGAPAGGQISDVVDNSNGTSIVYAYNPTTTVVQTASYYSSSDPATGAPTGTLTSETIDYTNGRSSITTYSAGATGTIAYFSGPDGTGSSVASAATKTNIALSTDAVTAVAADSAVQPGISSDGSVIAIIGSGQLIDPGTGSHSIQFLSGAVNDALVLHLGASSQILGFDPNLGDQLDLSSLFAEAGVNLSGITQLTNDVSVNTLNGAAQIMFDATGHGGGTQVALLVSGGSTAAQIQAAIVTSHLT